MFLLAEAHPVPETLVHIKVFLPPLEAWTEGLRMEVQGRVLREERGKPGRLGSGLAVINQTVVLRDSAFGIVGRE